MAKQHRRDHRHHAQQRRAGHSHRQPDHPAGGEGGPEPGGPLMMSRDRTLMALISGILVIGLIVFGVLWAVAWS